MKKSKQIRSNWMNVRLSENEKTELEKLYKKTTCQSLSEYVRDVLLRKPVTVYYRDPIADDFLRQLIQLRDELNFIGKLVNEDVHHLHSFEHIEDVRIWAISFEANKKRTMNKTFEISEKLDEIAQTYQNKSSHN
jgi:MobC-like protein